MGYPAETSRRQVRRGLTLTELLVVLAVLGAITTGIVPSVRLIMASVNAEDTNERLAASWQLAGALARAQQRPVLWRVAASETNCEVSIVDADGAVLWIATIDASHLRSKIKGFESDTQNLSFVMYPNGLTDAIDISWEVEGQRRHLMLGETITSLAASGSG